MHTYMYVCIHIHVKYVRVKERWKERNSEIEETVTLVNDYRVESTF